MYKMVFKRLIDLLVSLCVFTLFLPVFILLTIFLVFSNNGKPYFYQVRPGFRGKLFRIIKFKTMNDKTDEGGNLLPDHLRITKVGNFIRKTSLDEVPQLINVIKGEMSLIGPRPLLEEYLELYNDEQKKRHNVKPGITGWAQVNGRNTISWQEKFKLDVFYVNNLSLLLDLKIVLKSMQKVILRSDVNASESLTMVKFKGN